MPITLTKALIATHERLFRRIASLLKQVERVAGRQPTMAVPEESAKLARELCRETVELLGKDGRGIGLPRTAKAGTLDHTALAVALGQALAGLEAFEGEHAMLSHKHQAICWLLPDGQRQPVARHLPATPPKHATAWAAEEHQFSEADRKRVMRRFIERENVIYLRGYHDCQQGKPPREPLDEFEIV